MLNIRNFRHLLVALVFLASQWVLVVHATEHQLKSSPDAACQLCSVANAASTAPTAPLIPDAAPLESFALVLSSLATPASTQLQLPPSRGPPNSLV